MQTEARAIDLHNKRKFAEYLGGDDYDRHYLSKIKQSIEDGSFRFVMNINELRSRDNDLAAQIIKRPRENIIALQDAAMESAKNMDPTFEKVLNNKELQVGFEGSFGVNSVSPRGLNSTLLDTLVEVEGIVVKCSNVRPKLVKSVQFCPNTSQYSLREFRDATSIDIGIEVREGSGERMPTTTTLPTEDGNKNPLELEHGFCVYKDYQTLVLQEMPERSKVGQLPRSVEVILEHDLVDKAKPGDRVVCVGVYRSLPSVVNGQTSGVFRTVLICNNVQIMGKEIGAVKLTGRDISNIRELSSKEDILDTMARSLCPSIFGHDFIKKALILQLLGGCERNLENGGHLRGDINIMLVGDPSTAKSQLLRSVMDIAPLAISTTGRGSSGVGLTAAVTMDSENGEKRLEAGAMVLADRGIVCIDEFDKMNENDRVAIHEVMEQQTVTIAKAGIHAALNARCSVIAAANPVYGQYDKSRRPQDNIGLPDSLLSRFDLLFIVLDQLDPVLDRTLSEHVINSHQYRRPGTLMEPEPLNQGHSINLDDLVDNGNPVDTPVWLRSGVNQGDSDKRSENDLLTKEFLRKYIHFAKNRIQPVLSDASMDRISQAYAGMRSHQSKKNLPITARTLETIIRISTAAAKCRLSNSVDIEDVDKAVELINFVLFHDIGSSAPVSTQPAKTQSTPIQQSSSSAPAPQPEEDNQFGFIKDLLEKEIYAIIEKYAKNGEQYIAYEELFNEITSNPILKQVQMKDMKEILVIIQQTNKIQLEDDLVFIV